MWMAMVFPSQDRHYTKLSTLSFELSHSNRYLYLSIGFFHQARRNVSSILHIAKLARPMDKYFYMNIWYRDIAQVPRHKRGAHQRPQKTEHSTVWYKYFVQIPDSCMNCICKVSKKKINVVTVTARNIRLFKDPKEPILVVFMWHGYIIVMI